MRLAILAAIAAIFLSTGTGCVRLPGSSSGLPQELRAPSAETGEGADRASSSNLEDEESPVPPPRLPTDFSAEPTTAGNMGRLGAGYPFLYLLAGFGLPAPAGGQTGTVLMDGQQYLTNAHLSEQIADPYLRGCLAFAYSYAPRWRRVADSAAARGVTVRWKEMAIEVNSLYDPHDNTIWLNTDLKDEPGQVIAASMAHEAFHASHDTGLGAGEGFQEEVDAHAWEAYVWSRLPRSQPHTARERYMDELVNLWHSRELGNFIVTMPGYQQAFLGKPLVSP